MLFDDYLQFCERLPFVTSEFPFDATTLVCKVKGKMFALTDITLFESINIKCHPDKAIELRERYEAVQPGYHMSKVHWNTILIDGRIGDKLLREWILDSYKLVVAGLPKKDRFELPVLNS
jgi:predicted DNA-binding protein (MmcQ/YjbR family)